MLRNRKRRELTDNCAVEVSESGTADVGGDVPAAVNEAEDRGGDH